MALQLAARWLIGGAEIDTRLLPLLRAIAATGSLNQAVASLRMSYRHAWGLLGKTERTFGQRLVVLERGRGARLSPFGEKLLAADDAGTRIFGRELADMTQSLNRELAALQRRSPARSLVVHASHDLALGELRDLLSKSKDTLLDLHFRGSLECLADLAAGKCDIAGFHVPDIAGGSTAYEPYRPRFRARSAALVRFVTRRQGLMVARGNPKRIRSLQDLVTSRVRFVNRQPGSGTRLCLDQLLDTARIRPSQIRGYQTEEFTHAAVAATVASGMAEAGFGIEAAARQQGLDFVALATERYYLAARESTLARPAGRALLAALASASFRRRVEALPGYDVSGIGSRVSARIALGRP